MVEHFITPVDKLSPKDVEEMFRLMQKYYENVFFDSFEADLREKDSVVILKQRKELCGFSTYLVLNRTVSGRRIKVLFSGDTIVAEQCRNSVALPFVMSRMMLEMLKNDPHVPLYWLLTTKGYKTFRCLPVFFRSYFPSPGKMLSPFETDLLEDVTAKMFNGRMDKERWILRAGEKDQRLRSGVADITEAKRLRPDIAYFEKMNPSHTRGDELVCLAQFYKDNLKPLVLRKLLEQ